MLVFLTGLGLDHFPELADWIIVLPHHWDVPGIYQEAIILQLEI